MFEQKKLNTSLECFSRGTKIFNDNYITNIDQVSLHPVKVDQVIHIKNYEQQ